MGVELYEISDVHGLLKLCSAMGMTIRLDGDVSCLSERDCNTNIAKKELNDYMYHQNIFLSWDLILQRATQFSVLCL